MTHFRFNRCVKEGKISLCLKLKCHLIAVIKFNHVCSFMCMHWLNKHMALRTIKPVIIIIVSLSRRQKKTTTSLYTVKCVDSMEKFWWNYKQCKTNQMWSTKRSREKRSCSPHLARIFFANQIKLIMISSWILLISWNVLHQTFVYTYGRFGLNHNNQFIAIQIYNHF